MVTLHHFTEPKWWDAKGGWEVRENIADFERFAIFVAARLAPHCQYWYAYILTNLKMDAY